MTAQDSIRTTTVWQTENDIVIPVVVEERVSAPVTAAPARPATVTATSRPVKARHEVPALLAYPYTASPLSVNGDKETGIQLPADSLARDSVATDSVGPLPGETLREGIVLINPASEYIRRAGDEPKQNISGGSGMSWIYLALLFLFCVIGLKFKGNSRYVKALVADLTDTRVRHNAFDETVRETSLLVLLNLMWAACAGVLLWVLLLEGIPSGFADSLSIQVSAPVGIGICIGIAAAYLLLTMLAYWIVGNVFADRAQTRVWLKGAAASTGLQTAALFPVALLTLAYPVWNSTMLIIAACVFGIGKIIFLYKGFRIFFTQISSWLLFLYYLCSLEIVPLILSYAAAVALCTRG